MGYGHFPSRQASWIAYLLSSENGLKGAVFSRISLSGFGGGDCASDIVDVVADQPPSV